MRPLQTRRSSLTHLHPLRHDLDEVVKKLDRKTVSEKEAYRIRSENKLVPLALPDLVRPNASDTTSGEMIIEARSLLICYHTCIIRIARISWKLKTLHAHAQLIHTLSGSTQLCAS